MSCVRADAPTESLTKDSGIQCRGPSVWNSLQNQGFSSYLGGASTQLKGFLSNLDVENIITCGPDTGFPPSLALSLPLC